MWPRNKTKLQKQDSNTEKKVDKGLWGCHNVRVLIWVVFICKVSVPVSAGQKPEAEQAAVRFSRTAQRYQMDELDAEAFYMSERRTKVTPTFMIKLEEELASIQAETGCFHQRCQRQHRGPTEQGWKRAQCLKLWGASDHCSHGVTASL